MADKKKGGAPPAAHAKGAPQQKDSGRGPRRDNRNTFEDDSAIKHIPKVARPSREKFEQDMKTLNDQMNSAGDRLKETQDKITKLTDEKKNLFHKKDEIINQLKDLRAISSQAKQNKIKYISDIKALGEQKQKKYEELNKLKDKLPPKVRGESSGNFDLKTVLDNIDLKINKLENKLKVTSMPLAEEKTVVAKISSLHNAKKLAREYDQERQKIMGLVGSTNQSVKSQRDALDDLIKAQEQLFKDTKVKEEALQAELEKVRAQLNKVTEVELPQLIKDRDQSRHGRDDIRDQKKELFRRRDEEQAQWAEYQAKVNQVKAEEWKKNAAQRAIDNEIKKEEYLKQQLDSVPHQEQIEYCDLLILRLEQYLIKPEEEETSEEQAAPAAVPTTPEGAVVLKRDVSEEVADAYKGGKSKKAKKPKATVLKADSVLKHNLSTLQQFEHLSLACPVKVSDVPKSIEEIKEKKAFYTKLSAETKKRIVEEYAKKQSEAKAKAEAAEADSNAATTTSSGEADNAETTEVHS